MIHQMIWCSIFGLSPTYSSRLASQRRLGLAAVRDVDLLQGKTCRKPQCLEAKTVVSCGSCGVSPQSNPLNSCVCRYCPGCPRHFFGFVVTHLATSARHAAPELRRSDVTWRNPVVSCTCTTGALMTRCREDLFNSKTFQA